MSFFKILQRLDRRKSVLPVSLRREQNLKPFQKTKTMKRRKRLAVPTSRAQELGFLCRILIR
jgi:hypothetical protein